MKTKGELKAQVADLEKDAVAIVKSPLAALPKIPGVITKIIRLLLDIIDRLPEGGTHGI